MADELLLIEDLECAYGASGRRIPGRPPKPRQSAVRNVSIELSAGQTLALVGESGSGKTTIARAVAGLLPPTRGTITFRGHDITGPVEGRPRETRRAMQFVFQNPDAALNPRRRVGAIVGRPLEHFFDLGGARLRARIAELLSTVHLESAYAARFPSQLSGGERQRVALAQALAADPELILCDEILSALDVSVQASVLDLLRELQQQRGVAYLFISHDLAVVRHLADRVAVLYGGQLMEEGRSDEIFRPPHHPYTRLLLDSVPGPGEAARSTEPDAGREASAAIPDHGCPFAPRCGLRIDGVCEAQELPSVRVSDTHVARCHALARDAGAASTRASVTAR